MIKASVDESAEAFIIILDHNYFNEEIHLAIFIASSFGTFGNAAIGG